MTDPHTNMSTEQEKQILDAQEAVAQFEDVHMALGQIQAFDFISKLTTVGSLKTLIKIKESKQFKGLTYCLNGKLLTVGSWEEFCEHKLPWSRSTTNEKIANFKALGEEYFESADRLGLSTKHMRKLRALPDDARIEAMEADVVDSGDKEAVQELIDDIHAKHNKDIKDTQLKLKDTEQTLSSSRKMVAENSQKIEELTTQLNANRHDPQFWPGEVQAIVTNIMQASGKAFGGVAALDTLLSEIELSHQQQKLPTEAYEYICGAFLDTVGRLAQVSAVLMQNADFLTEQFDYKPKVAQEVLEELVAIAQGEQGEG